jgi:hypothetical protein
MKYAPLQQGDTITIGEEKVIRKTYRKGTGVVRSSFLALAS